MALDLFIESAVGVCSFFVMAAGAMGLLGMGLSRLLGLWG
jgi:hypothetical protein